MEQVSKKETQILLEIARRSLECEGDFVEFGCYRGETSVLLAKLLRNNVGERKKLWVYDSFEGLPERSTEDSSVAGEAFKPGELKVTKREVVEKFRKAGVRPVVKKGFFEDLIETDLPRDIAFGFLDGDFYQSIKTSLKLTAPRVNSGGILVVHDYNNPELPGAARAVDEWLQQKLAKKRQAQLEVRESLAILRFMN